MIRVATALVCATAAASHAAITCVGTVTAMTVVYDPTVAADNVTSGTLSLSCNRLASDPDTFDWAVGADNGGNPGGGSNRATLAGNTYQYRLFRNPPYTNPNRWRDTRRTRLQGTVAFGGSLSATDSGSFDLVVPGSQTVVPAGTYLDTVTATLRDAATQAVLGTTPFGVSIITTNSCQISVPPGDVNFSYTSLQGTAASANTAFGVRCTTALPYTMSLDATSGTLLGLNYTLSLSSTLGIGTGVTQTYSINGGITAGQAGICATAVCSGSETRTLIVSY